jgi:hypothetical protein
MLIGVFDALLSKQFSHLLDSSGSLIIANPRGV